MRRADVEDFMMSPNLFVICLFLLISLLGSVRHDFVSHG